MKINRTDCLLHFLCGCIVCYATCDFGWYWSLAVVTIVAGAKEAYDAITKNGTAEMIDFLSTIASFPVVMLVEQIKSILI